MDIRQSRVFSPLLEKCYFVLLSLFLGLFVLSLFGYFSFSTSENPFLELVVSFLFMNTAHTFLTVIFLVCLPEFRNWLKEKLSSRRWFLQTSLMCLLIGVGAYFSAMHAHLSYKSWAAFFVVLVIFESVHTVSQIKGFSLIYNRNQLPLLSEEERRQQQKIEKRERFLFDAFLVMIVAQFAFTRVFKMNTAEIQWSYIGLCLSAAALIYVNSLFYPQIAKSNKRFYLLSCLFPVFAPYFPVAFAFQRSLHGMEYTFYCYDVSKRSAILQWGKTIIAMTVLALTFLVLTLPASVDFAASFNQIPPSLQFVMAFLFFYVSYFHYYMDSQMFRFGDPAVKKHLSSLLLPQETSVSAPVRA